jgi:hypothetical protein
MYQRFCQIPYIYKKYINFSYLPKILIIDVLNPKGKHLHNLSTEFILVSLLRLFKV